MTSRLRTRSHDHYGPGEYNPRHDKDAAQTVLFKLLDDAPLPIVNTEWTQHLGPALGIDCTSLKDVVNQLRDRPWRFIVEGDRSRGYRVVGVERWRRGT